MRKVILFSGILFTSVSLQAQEVFYPLQDRQFVFDVLNICAVLLVIYMISRFILQLIKLYLDRRLKGRIIELQTPENIIHQLLPVAKKEKGAELLQWFFVLAGIAVGFVIVKLTMPFGLHSMAILAACVAGGCAGAYYFTRNKPMSL
jgi:hypothetical protein